MTEVYNEKRHRSQKIRRCEGCWYKTDTNPIQIGDFYWNCFCVFYGDASRFDLCESCHDFLSSVDGAGGKLPKFGHHSPVHMPEWASRGTILIERGSHNFERGYPWSDNWWVEVVRFRLVTP